MGERDAAKGFRTVLVQQLTLQLTTDADIRSHPNADPPLFAWPVTALYELTAFSVDVDCCLRAAPHAVEFGPPPPLPVASRPRSSRRSSPTFDTATVLAPSGTLRMGLNALGLPSGFLNAGVTVSDTGTMLAIRVEIRASQDLYWAAWQNFHKGFIVDPPEGRDGAHVPAAYLPHRIITGLWENLPKDDDLEAYPGAVYVPLPGRARFDVNVLLIYHAAEVEELDLDITVSADPRVQLSMWVDQPNRLSAEIDFAGLVNPVGALSTLAVAFVDALGIRPGDPLLARWLGDRRRDRPTADDRRVATHPDHGACRPGFPDPRYRGCRMGDRDRSAGTSRRNRAGRGVPGDRAVDAVVEAPGVQQFEKHAPKISCGAASMALIALFGSDRDGSRSCTRASVSATAGRHRFTCVARPRSSASTDRSNRATSTRTWWDCLSTCRSAPASRIPPTTRRRSRST